MTTRGPAFEDDADRPSRRATWPDPQGAAPDTDADLDPGGYDYAPHAGDDGFGQPVADEPNTDAYARLVYAAGERGRARPAGEEAVGRPPRRPAPDYHRGKGPRGRVRTDARILEDVSDRLMADPDLDAGDIEVEVRGGLVTLTGTVLGPRERRWAEADVWTATGVVDVRNHLEVRYDVGAPPIFDAG